MTINVAVATYDAIVLGCDSLSSVVCPIINLGKGSAQAFGADGVPILDASGRPTYVITDESVEYQPTTVFGGVSKMFLLYEDKDTSVAAITSGQGTINGRTIAALASGFKRALERDRTLHASVESVARDFAQFMHYEWAKQPELQGVPEESRKFMPTVNFIVGGYGKDDQCGRVFKLDIARHECTEAFPDAPHSGVTWGGQANFVERVLRGSEFRLEQIVSRRIVEALTKQREGLVDSIANGLAEAGVQIPEGTKFNFEEILPPSDSWNKFWVDIDYPNLPVQYAVDLVSLLVNIQSGMQHFGSGIATVGGRTHVGVLQRNSPFRKLKEPKLAHAHTGYSHEH